MAGAPTAKARPADGASVDHRGTHSPRHAAEPSDQDRPGGARSHARNCGNARVLPGCREPLPACRDFVPGSLMGTAASAAHELARQTVRIDEFFRPSSTSKTARWISSKAAYPDGTLPW